MTKTLRPRLDALAGDVRRIHFLGGRESDAGPQPVTLGDVAVLEEVFEYLIPFVKEVHS